MITAGQEEEDEEEEEEGEEEQEKERSVTMHPARFVPSSPQNDVRYQKQSTQTPSFAGWLSCVTALSACCVPARRSAMRVDRAARQPSAMSV